MARFMGGEAVPTNQRRQQRSRPHLRTPHQNDPFCVKARKDDICVVSELWVEDSITHGTLADPKRVIYWPLKDLAGIPGCLLLHICATGYSVDRQKEIRRMCDSMGASFYEQWTDTGTHLICYKFEGHDYKVAKKCKADVVNHKWLEDCLKEWRIIPIDNYTISGWEVDIMETKAEPTNKELVFQPNQPMERWKRNFQGKHRSFPPTNSRRHTPETKVATVDKAMPYTSKLNFSI